jgi:hypothetical protein
LVMASAASIAGTRPRVSIIPNAIPIFSFAISILLLSKLKSLSQLMIIINLGINTGMLIFC